MHQQLPAASIVRASLPSTTLPTPGLVGADTASIPPVRMLKLRAPPSLPDLSGVPPADLCIITSFAASPPLTSLPHVPTPASGPALASLLVVSCVDFAEPAAIDVGALGHLLVPYCAPPAAVRGLALHCAHMAALAAPSAIATATAPLHSVCRLFIGATSPRIALDPAALVALGELMPGVESLHLDDVAQLADAHIAAIALAFPRLRELVIARAPPPSPTSLSPTASATGAPAIGAPPPSIPATLAAGWSGREEGRAPVLTGCALHTLATHRALERLVLVGPGAPRPALDAETDVCAADLLPTRSAQIQTVHGQLSTTLCPFA